MIRMSAVRSIAPPVLAELASAVQAAYLPKDRAAAEILDAGYGTGLVTGQMKRLGLRYPMVSSLR
ncbi:hypothetical protein ABID25_006371 [Mesorhizobium abyssinicae]